MHKVSEFNQEALLKPYIEINTESIKRPKKILRRTSSFFMLMNNSVLGKTMENERSHRDIKLMTNDKRRHKLASEHNYIQQNISQKEYWQLK